MQVKIDKKPKLTEKYLVDVVPTLLVFEREIIKKHLYVEAGADLNKKQFKKLTKS
jgi:hypothetical protein